MPYVEDENGGHILDGNGQKMKYIVEHSNKSHPTCLL